MCVVASIAIMLSQSLCAQTRNLSLLWLGPVPAAARPVGISLNGIQLGANYTTLLTAIKMYQHGDARDFHDNRNIIVRDSASGVSLQAFYDDHGQIIDVQSVKNCSLCLNGNPVLRIGDPRSALKGLSVLHVATESRNLYLYQDKGVCLEIYIGKGDKVQAFHLTRCHPKI
jgi:hypothetical protein